MSNSLLLKIESAIRMLEVTENELNKKRDLLDIIKNSEEYVTLKNKIEEHINEFLNDKREFFKLAVTTILDIIKKDPDKDILINNSLYPNENQDSQFYLSSYEEKIAQIAADKLSDIALVINI